jgi:hypothetical protein
VVQALGHAAFVEARARVDKRDRPSASILDPIRDLPGMVAPSSSTHDLQALPVHFYAASGYRDALPSWLERALYPTSWWLLLPWAAVALVLLGGLALVGAARRVSAVPVVLVLSAIPHSMIVWGGDSAGMGRHAPCSPCSPGWA